MDDRLREQVKRLYQPLRRRHDALKESLLASLDQPAMPTLQIKRNHRMRIVKMLSVSSLAAAILLVVGLVATSYTAKPVSAAQQLEGIARINGAYKGWVHMFGSRVKPEAEPASAPTGSPVPEAIEWHMNAGEKEWGAILVFPGGAKRIHFASLSECEVRSYDSVTNRIEINSLDPAVAERMIRGTTRVLTAEGMVEQLAETNGTRFKLTKTREGQMDRFQIVPEEGAQKDVSEDEDTTSILVDPDTKLIQQLVTHECSIRVSFRYVYGEPIIQDIYDLGVPRDATVLDKRSQAK